MFVPPWNEWSNDFINAENWDPFNGQQDFVHPGGHERLPIEVQRRVVEWKRPCEMFGVEGLAVQSNEDKNDIHNLLTVNESLMNVKVYRWILYHVVLYTSRFKKKWPQPWHPSSLVFSRCKAEVVWNKKSKPEYNPYGKYWLKLFFMGKFRMVCVSDHLPISDDNQILLPLCKNNKVLWLPLLVKGLLRVYTMAHKFHEFNTITCLTGWSCIRNNCQFISKENLWLSFLSHASNNSSDHADGKNVKKKNITECFPVKTLENTQCYKDLSFETNLPKSVVIAITLSPTINKKKSNSLNRYSQPAFLNYIKTVKNKSLPTWKKHRWMKWAIENNQIKQHELCDFVKLTNIYAPCTVILKQTCPLMKILNEYKTAEDETQYELDFSYLEPFTTNKTDENGDRNEYADPSEWQMPTNELLQHCCVYLYFESSYCQSMLFTLTVCNNYTIRDGNIVLDESTTAYPIDYSYYVNVEQFFWYKTKPSTLLSSIRTRGISYDVVKFQPGINVLKVWGELPVKYSLVVESTVEFSVHHTTQTVYENLTNQPKSLTSFLTSIKNAFLQLWNAKPDTSDHGQKLQEFYLSFMPLSTNQENELKKIERLSVISKLVQTAVVEWVEHNFPNDLNCNMIEVYTELQILFQNKLFGQKQIYDLNQKTKSPHLEGYHVVPHLNKQQSQFNDKSPKKSIIKLKSNVKHQPPTSSSTSIKLTISKVIHDNMLEVLCDVFNSNEIDLNEYYLENDLLNYVINISYDENIKKHIDPILLFRLELNTHSTSELAPTIIKFLNKCNNNCPVIHLTLIDNDSLMEIMPLNLETDLFKIKRTTRGYTLLGWISDINSNFKNCSEHKLSLIGRPCQILHACGMPNDRFYGYSTTVCNNLYTPRFVTKHVKHKLYKHNIDNLLARAYLNVDNAALYTIYCYLEGNFNEIALEIRVIDKNCSSTIFASSRVYEKMALIPIVFLNPNYYNDDKTYYYDDTENSINTITFSIEVILIKNIKIDYIETPEDESNEYFWTISCTFDSKITDVVLEPDTLTSDYQFFSSIPSQTYNNQRRVTISTSQKLLSKSQLPITSASKSKIEVERPILNHREILETMIKPNNISIQNLLDTTDTEDQNTIRNFLNDLIDRQTVTGNAIKYNVDAMRETRQVVMDNLYGKILNFLNMQRKSNTNVKSNISEKQSQKPKKKQ